MAGKLCLQNGIELVDFCFGRDNCIGDCVADGELAELAGDEEEPGGGVEV